MTEENFIGFTQMERASRRPNEAPRCGCGFSNLKARLVLSSKQFGGAALVMFMCDCWLGCSEMCRLLVLLPVCAANAAILLPLYTCKEPLCLCDGEGNVFGQNQYIRFASVSLRRRMAFSPRVFAGPTPLNRTRL